MFKNRTKEGVPHLLCARHPPQNAGAAGQRPPDRNISWTSITWCRGRVIVTGPWRLINISCFENKLLGLALTLIYYQEPIISKPMFCSIDLLDFFFFVCFSPQDQNIIAFLQAARPLMAALCTHIPVWESQDGAYLGGLERVAGEGGRVQGD